MPGYAAQFASDFRTEEEVTPHSGLKRCRYNTANGRRCRMISVDELGFCARHRSYDEELVAMELNISPEEFKTAVGLNRFVGKVTALTAQNRLPVRTSATLAYLAQLLLQTLDRAQREISDLHGSAALEKLVAAALAKDDSLASLRSGSNSQTPSGHA
jgi:hypothetical protein